MSRRRDGSIPQRGGELPREAADRFTRPFARFLEIEAATGVLLAVAGCAALALSNSPWSHRRLLGRLPNALVREVEDKLRQLGEL